MGNKGVVEIHPDELDALREQASQAIPWENEAIRLAAALRALDPNHSAISSGFWREHFESTKPREFSPLDEPDPLDEQAAERELEAARVREALDG